MYVHFTKWHFLQTTLPQEKTYIYNDERIYNFYVGNNYFTQRNKFGLKWNSILIEKKLKDQLTHKHVL
jgi:hypothetical protein